MKKTIVFLLVAFLIATSVWGLNVGLDCWTTKPTYYDNEDVELNVNLTNYELSLSPENPKLVIIVDNETIEKEIGELSPDKSITKKLNLGRFKAGTYRLEIYLESEFLTVIDKTQSQYQQIQILPSEPIRMKIDSVSINSIKIPKTIKVGEEFEVEVKIESTTDDAEVEFSLMGEHTKTKKLKEGTNKIILQYTLDTAGSYLFEGKTFVKDGEESSIKDYKTQTIVVSDQSIYKKLKYQEIEQKKSSTILELGKKPAKNLIEEVGCFVVGGCNGDLYPPEVTIDKVITQGDITYYLFTADDSKAGDSSITGCEIKLGNRGWEVINGSYNSSTIHGNYSAEASIADYTVELRCIDGLKNTGYASVGVKQEYDVLIITNEANFNKTGNYDATIYEYLSSLETDGLSGAYLDLSDEKTLRLFGLEKGAGDSNNIKNTINLISSKKSARYLILLGNNEIIPSVEVQGSKTLVLDDPYADLNGDGVADIPISRLLSDSASTETLEKQLKGFSGLHEKQAPAYVLTAKSKKTSSGSLLESLADTVCGTPLKYLFYSACNSVAPVAGEFVCEGACFIVTNHETLGKLGTAVVSGNVSMAMETVEDGSFFVMLGDGLHLAETGGLIDSTDYQSGMNFINKVDDMVSVYKKYKQQYGALRTGDLILESKKAGTSGVSLKDANIEDLYGLSLEMFNGDPTLRVEVKNE